MIHQITSRVWSILFGLGLGWLTIVTSAAVNEAEKISVNLTNIEVRDLIKILTRSANKSVIISEKITGKITVNLYQLNWQEALTAVLRMQGLIKQETPQAIIITPPIDASKNERMILPIKHFTLHYTAAEEMIKLLKSAGILSAQGQAEAETKTNTLVVTDTDEHLRSVTQLLQHLDQPAHQVLIEARIVSADENFIHELGVEFGSSKVTPGETSSNHLPAVTLHQNQLRFAIAKLDKNSWIDLELEALEAEGKGRVIAKPKLLTTDRKPAYIEAGAEIPYQEKTKNGNTNVAFKKAVLSLKVTPEIATADTINLALELNQDKVGQLTVHGVPTIDTRKIHTQVLVKNNETIVLGGIYEWNKNYSITSVPLLGKLPLIKLFFSKKSLKMERKELLIFITPKIVK